jgi:hypothetical protein
MSEQPAAFEYRTTRARAALGFAGALGAFLVPLLAVHAADVGSVSVFLRDSLAVVLGIAFLLGLACPVWWALDRRGLRRGRHAALVGDGFGGLIGMGLSVALIAQGMLHAPELPLWGVMAMLAGMVLFYTGGGALLGLLGWRIAYRKVPVEDPRRPAEPGQAWLVR